MTPDLEQLERITSEHLDVLDDSDLVEAGALADELARRWAAVAKELGRETQRRMEMADATLAIGTEHKAVLVRTPGVYQWDVERVRELMQPYFGEKLLGQIITEVPHVCPPTEYRVDTTALKSTAKKLGQSVLLETCYTRDPGPAKVRYEEVA